MSATGTIIITGGAGFIGSFVVKEALAKGLKVVNVDKLTYASNLEFLNEIENSENYFFERADICSYDEIKKIFYKYKPFGIINLAAETHVDNSIKNPSVFIDTNIVGTMNLLEVTRNYLSENSFQTERPFIFHQVSTDEVFGDLSADEQSFTENSHYKPSSPYSASKASSDHLLRAWSRTYGLNHLITNCSNNFGPNQNKEKLIPKTITNIIQSLKIPIYGNGLQIRDWLYVEDHAKCLLEIFMHASPNNTYLIGNNCEKTNISVVKDICNIIDKKYKKKLNLKEHPKNLIQYVDDRLGHDSRYAINNFKLVNELNWKPGTSFKKGLEMTIDWYIKNSLK